ncbi:YunC family protein [Falsiroseomonas oryziterrae]|uniref:YunC family protein n=1 Tax=Falsiroseomonas oryziterrae TaxID=2911368 RepID=UPI001F187A1C|nr:YunC family protein [Roseomonas sp. NPKOSM-4]
MSDGPLVLDSVTHLPADAGGRVALCASHGGIYAAWYAARRGVSAMILHDAGIGRERAGVGGLDWLAARGLPAVAVCHRSARIGDGADMLARGRLSTVNAPAAALGIEVGMPAADALSRLAAAPPAAPTIADDMDEARRDIAAHHGIRVVALDSNGLVGPEDAGHVVVTGSHGGLLGGRPETAVKAPVLAAIYNDAGIGADDAGISRLPALEARGIAGACVSCFSARIGDAMSTWQDGFVSALNPTAAARGGRIGQSARDFVAALLEHA